MQIATDDQGLNVVEVNFTYVTEKYTKSGKDNATYAVLNQIIESGKTFEEVGTAATKVRVDGSVEVNDFPGRDGNMVAAKRIGGSFVHFMNGPITQAPSFETDMLIAGTSMHEVENGDDYLDIRGYAFNFRGDLVPVNYSVINEGGIKYFEDCDISNANPLLTKV